MTPIWWKRRARQAKADHERFEAIIAGDPLYREVVRLAQRQAGDSA